MASRDEHGSAGVDHDDDSDGEETAATRYRAPQMKTLSALIEQDKGDESLTQYKNKLLGSSPLDLVLYQRRTVKPIVIISDLSTHKANKHVIKEGCHYRLRFHFFVQREIVTGFKYVQKVYRKGIRFGSTEFVAGSFGPKEELQTWTSGPEETPSGFAARGTYTVKGLFTDIDRNEYLKWDWKLEIKKEWPH